MDFLSFPHILSDWTVILHEVPQCTYYFCQAQPNPSSSWAELALFSLSPAYGLHNIAYGLHNIAYGLHNIAYGLHNIGKVT